MSVEKLKPMHASTAHLAKQVIAVAEAAQERPNEVAELKKTLKDSVDALHVALEAVGVSLVEFRPVAAAYAVEIRQFRAAATLDLGNAKRDLQDIREFFLSDQHKVEMERLRDFVELCERFQKVKADGTVEAIVDAVIKLTPAST